MVLFTQNFKKIKGAAHENCDVDSTCKQPLQNKIFKVDLGKCGPCQLCQFLSLVFQAKGPKSVLHGLDLPYASPQEALSIQVSSSETVKAVFTQSVSESSSVCASVDACNGSWGHFQASTLASICLNVAIENR